MSDPLFYPSTTHIEVQCWRCPRRSVVRPEELPPQITEPEFSRRARCSDCGATWPQITRLPKEPSRWGIGESAD